jgi:hypothetical protein
MAAALGFQIHFFADIFQEGAACSKDCSRAGSGQTLMLVQGKNRLRDQPCEHAKPICGLIMQCLRAMQSM